MLYSVQIVLYTFDMEKIENRYNADGEYGKRGYLKESYRVFNIKDRCIDPFEFHYHEFDKIVFFLSGNVKYIIEGKTYYLKPYDILLVRHGDIHRPVIDPSADYERIIIWADDNYLNSNNRLSECFDKAGESGVNYVMAMDNEKQKIFDLLKDLIHEGETEFAGSLMKDTLFTQLMIRINRAVIANQSKAAAYKSDRQIDGVIEYINKNLFSPLTVEKISAEFFISRYHLMHKFKAATGKTIFSYIQTKRLLYAASLLNDGASAKTACFESGYNDYSVFLKAFKKEFGITPAEYAKQAAFI